MLTLKSAVQLKHKEHIYHKVFPLGNVDFCYVLSHAHSLPLVPGQGPDKSSATTCLKTGAAANMRIETRKHEDHI